MRIRTTTIGAWPKPTDVPNPDWFQQESTTDANPTEALDSCERYFDDDISELLDKVAQEVVVAQACYPLSRENNITRSHDDHGFCCRRVLWE